MRLNLGCGLRAPEGWINIDRSPNLTLDRVPVVKGVLHSLGVLRAEHMVSWPRNIRRLDVRKALPYASGEVAAIYSSHMLEHLYYDEALAVLRECRRVLGPEGILRLALPDGEDIARTLVESVEDGTGEAGLNFTRGLMMSPLSRPSPTQRLVGRLASPPHRWQPTPGLVLSMVRQAGFRECRTVEFLEGQLPDLAEVEHRANSLFVEAYV